MTAKLVSITEFKAKCLRLIHDLSGDGQPVIITKRGRPVARLSPIPLPNHQSMVGAMKGTATYVGDPFAPATDPTDWTANV